MFLDSEMKVKELPSPISLPRVVLWVSGVMFLATPHVCCLHSTSLFQWAESRGAELGRASLRPASEVMPRGVVAECPVGANEPLIVIPRSLILTPSQRLVVGKDVVSPVHYDRATEKEKLAYTLLALLEQKENDAWEGFFSYLPPPEDFSMCAVAWTDEQLGRLASPRLAVAAKNQRERRKLAVEAVLKGDKNAARARKVYWALDIVNSRARKPHSALHSYHLLSYISPYFRGNVVSYVTSMFPRSRRQVWFRRSYQGTPSSESPVCFWRGSPLCTHRCCSHTKRWP